MQDANTLFWRVSRLCMLTLAFFITPRLFSISLLRLPPHGRCPLVAAQPEKRRVAQVLVLGPFDEADLRDQRRPQPLHLVHLLGGHAAAPVRGLAVRQVDERARGAMERL